MENASLQQQCDSLQQQCDSLRHVKAELSSALQAQRNSLQRVNDELKDDAQRRLGRQPPVRLELPMRVDDAGHDRRDPRTRNCDLNNEAYTAHCSLLLAHAHRSKR